MLVLKPVHSLPDTDYYQMIPAPFQHSLADVKAFACPKSSDYFFFIIFSGFLPCGYIGHRVLCNGENHKIEIQHLATLHRSPDQSMIQDIANMLTNLPSFFLDIHFEAISLNLFEHNNLFPGIVVHLKANGWVSDSSSIYCSFDPFFSVHYWYSQLLRIGRVYHYMVDRESLKFISFDQLTTQQFVSLQEATSPFWAAPFHPSLLSNHHSKYSVAVFRGDTAISWFVADTLNVKSLAIETVWFDPSAVSVAVSYAMFYKSFIRFFPFLAPPGQYEFKFSYLNTNKTMPKLHQWLRPMLRLETSYLSYSLLL